jgi:hypothetical protein
VLVLVLVLVPVSVSISSILAVASAMLAQELIVSAPAVVVVVVVLAVTTATTAVSPSLMVRKLCDSLIDGYRERTRARVTDTRVTVLIEVTDKVVLELVFYQHIPVLMMKKTRIGVCIACILRVCRYLRRRLSAVVQRTMPVQPIKALAEISTAITIASMMRLILLISWINLTRISSLLHPLSIQAILPLI